MKDFQFRVDEWDLFHSVISVRLPLENSSKAMEKVFLSIDTEQVEWFHGGRGGGGHGFWRNLG